MMEELEALAPTVLAATTGLRLIIYSLIIIAIIIFVLWVIYLAIRDTPAKKIFRVLLFFVVSLGSFALIFIFPAYALASGWYWKTALASISIGTLLIPVNIMLDPSNSN
jgi:FtsH-binding integral membrane protein